MRYLIVMPCMTFVPEQIYMFPIGVAYVSSSLKASGREVYTYNLTYKSGTVEENIAKIINDNDIDVIATGGLTGQYWQLERILAAAKAVKKDIITAVGGGIITSAPEAAMKAFTCADYGMIGEGEITICEFADALEGKMDIADVKGLIYKKDGKWVQTERRPDITDLDLLPYPDYEGFDYADLLERTMSDAYIPNCERMGTVCFGRSCPFNCTFCFHPSGSKYRKRSMDSVFEEIDYLIEKFNIKNITVTDELFVAKMEDVQEFCKRIKERGIGFVISLRVDMVTRESLKLLKESGCLKIGFGLESADNSILSSMKKHITVEQIENALSLCSELGLLFNGNFIFGDQNETMETALNTINWWKAHPQYKISLVSIICFPGSELYKIAVQRGLIKDESEFIKQGCPYVNVSKMTEQEYKNLQIMIGTINQGSCDRIIDGNVKYIGYGKVDLSGKCPICGEYNVWKSQDLFRSSENSICSKCGSMLSILACDYIGDKAAEAYKKISDRKIGIWPVVSSVTEFFEKIPEAKNKNVYLIDKSEIKQGGFLGGKEVYSPNVIDEQEIDTVFVATTTFKSPEIINEIKEHKTVKNILFFGDLLRDDFDEIIK